MIMKQYLDTNVYYNIENGFITYLVTFYHDENDVGFWVVEEELKNDTNEAIENFIKNMASEKYCYEGYSSRGNYFDILDELKSDYVLIKNVTL